MISIDAKKQQKKDFVETISVPIYYAVKENPYNLMQGWYEWTESSPIDKRDCGEVTIAHLPNEPYNRYIRDQKLKHKKALRRGSLSNDKIRDIDIKAIALHGLKDWTGFKDVSTGSEIIYDSDIGFNVFSNDPSFLNFISDLCMDDELFIKTENEIEDAIKN
jgi:hypothetical protein